jgi:putative transposase
VKRRRHTPEQIVRKLREADRMLADGMETLEVCKALEESEATYHRWRAQFGGMKPDDVKRLKYSSGRTASSSPWSRTRSWKAWLSRSWRGEASEPVAPSPWGPCVAGSSRSLGAAEIPVTAWTSGERRWPTQDAPRGG